jgi:hypothetical protein
MIPYHTETEATRVVRNFDRFVNVPVTPKQLVTYLRKMAGQSTVITSELSEDVDPNTITMSAFYDPEEELDDRRPFELVLIFNPNDKQVLMGKEDWQVFTEEVIEYLEHEMIHQAQYRSRGFLYNRKYLSNSKDPNIKASQEYLGHPDEIDAYSHTLASELLRKTKDYDSALRLLKNFARTAMTKDQAGRFLSTNLYAYFKDFGFNTTHPVLKKLIKKTYHNIIVQKKKQERQERINKRNEDIEKTKKEIEAKRALDKQEGKTYTAIISI